MKYSIFFFVAAAWMVSCGPSAPAEKPVEFTSYGAAFDSTGTIPIAQLMKSMEGQDSLLAKVNCTILQTCTKAGCWMDVENPAGGEAITIFMKDHAFSVPLSECSGLNAIVDGKAYYDTLSVDFLRHLAEDAGKSAEEIALINEPRAVLAIDASGVMIKGYKGTAAADGHEGHDHNHEGHDHEGEEGASH